MKEHNYTIHRTRYENLGYFKIENNIWRFVDLQDRTPAQFPRAVGQTYRTKTELLADLERYATEVWSY
jgi:hypothetical protein